MTVIQSEKCFGVAGRAWAAISEAGEILKVIAMNNYPYHSPLDKDVLRVAGVTRLCRSAESEAIKRNNTEFVSHREKSRNELAKLGKVVSGMASCGEFCC